MTEVRWNVIFYFMNQPNKPHGNNSKRFSQQTNLTASSSNRGKTPEAYLRTRLTDTDYAHMAHLEGVIRTQSILLSEGKI
ncbi:hypothetical protein [Xenorhabdus ehlersii]|uniref:hypothetical protein n=1 Tax=Xenorhabdus ehlersii TaxID=290111 RepID=UPI001ABF2E34|nr:hypothetical protein [Xenorhabdus ehlersii]